ncbi:MAG: glycosyltransferase [Bacteroidota bacterium]
MSQTQEKKPVFFAVSDKRWRRFLGAVRILGVLVIFLMVLLGLTLFNPSQPIMPALEEHGEIYKKILNPERISTFQTKENLAYQKFRKKLTGTADINYSRYSKMHARSIPVKTTRTIEQIRAAFYVNWDAQSFSSLHENVDRLNMVFPEWMALPDSGDSAVFTIDNRALALLRDHNIAIMPMVTNFYHDKWNGQNVRRILAHESSRKACIQSILKVLEENKFAGVNIDFEELPERFDDELLKFQEELYRTLHGKGFLVSQDVAPFNADYDISKLQAFNDYIVIMAYDEHYTTSGAGPIASFGWVESILIDFSKKMDMRKCILGIPAYGYDWPRGDEGNDVSYEEAVNTAKEEDTTIIFNKNSANLSFTYYDDNQHLHDCWFTDAGTTFNLMRLASVYETRGVAMWRLGSEDRRLWKFYQDNVSDDSLEIHPLEYQSLESSIPTGAIDFDGEGEVLDLVATPDTGFIAVAYDTSKFLIGNEDYQRLPSAYIIKKFGLIDPNVKVLSFDDGPDARYTPAILDILREENVPASFFIVGINAESHLPIVKRMYEQGYEIGNHTFLHPNIAEVSPERTSIELNATRRLIESVTGHSTILFRPPYAADSEPETPEEILPIVEAKKEGYYTVGESIDPQDWEEGVTADSIIARIIQQQDNGNIILLHDAGGDRSQTVKALPIIIQYFKSKGCRFVSLMEYLGKTRDEIMPPLASRQDFEISRLNWTIAEVIYYFKNAFIAFFFLGLILSIGRTVFIAVIAWKGKKKLTTTGIPDGKQNFPFVDVIVPAYNEEITAVKTVNNLLKSDYPEFEIVFVDDGSKDSTIETMKKSFDSNPRVRILSKPNGGKASALNYGIERAKGDILVCIDADTLLQTDAITKLVSYFTDESVGAVAGNVKVGNERSLLTRWQAIEYITSQNFDRRAFDYLNCITVVPGAIGAFRKQVFEKIGGFSTDTLAEDCDLTIRLLREGYTVRYNPDAIAWTEVPETLRMFLKQRFRWTFGIMQSVWKHRDAFLKRENKSLGMIALPNAFLFQFIIPLLSPLADIMMIISIAGGFWHSTLMYYLIFMVVDFAGAWIAFSFEGEKRSRLKHLFFQRFVYRQLMYWVLFKSFLTAMKGSLVGWGILKRTGTVKAAG